MASMVLEILKGDALPDLVCCARNLWIALIVGVVIGWIWKPRWVNLGRNNKFMMKESSGFVSPMSFGSIPGLNSLKSQLPSCISWVSQNGDEKGTFSVLPNINSDYRSSPKEKPLAVTGDDVEHLCKLVEVKDGGPAWIQIMDRSAPNMRYQAWRRDPETGPPQYRSRTVFEDATPELVRDFFWDDDFRQQAKWDDMLMHSTILEECPTTGTMVVHWVRKFPFFCSDREYIIGRRIWESGRSYYCVTKGVPNSTVPRRNKPRRVDLYYSSWCIRAVESERDGQLTACEVLLFHHEDMGIPWEIAKLGVRQGMWGTVKKIEPGLRAYQRRRASETPLSRSAFMAQINTKLNTDYLRSLESKSDSSEVEVIPSPEKSLQRNNIPKLLIVGGVVALACSLDRGLLTKAVIFGVARRFGNIGRRL